VNLIFELALPLKQSSQTTFLAIAYFDKWLAIQVKHHRSAKSNTQISVQLEA